MHFLNIETVTSEKHSPIELFFKKKNRSPTIVLLWGHWHPCFGFLVTFPLGFKARAGSALFALSGGVRYTFPEFNSTLLSNISVYNITDILFKDDGCLPVAILSIMT